MELQLSVCASLHVPLTGHLAVTGNQIISRDIEPSALISALRSELLEKVSAFHLESTSQHGSISSMKVLI